MLNYLNHSEWVMKQIYNLLNLYEITDYNRRKKEYLDELKEHYREKELT